MRTGWALNERELLENYVVDVKKRHEKTTSSFSLSSLEMAGVEW
jgi:hypothetical protein